MTDSPMQLSTQGHGEKWNQILGATFTVSSAIEEFDICEKHCFSPPSRMDTWPSQVTRAKMLAQPWMVKRKKRAQRVTE